MSDFTRTKYIVYTILALIVLGVAGVMLYGFFSPSAPAPSQQQPSVAGRPVGSAAPGGEPNTTPAPALLPIPDIPSVTEHKLTRLTDFSVIGPAVAKNEDRVLFYKKDGGDLFSSDFSGHTQEKTAHVTVVGLTELIWSPMRDRAAVFYLGGDVRKGFIHIATTSIALLPQNITSLSWSPDGKSLAYLVPADGAANLVIAEASGKNPKTVFTTPITDAAIMWISSDKIGFATAPSGLAEGFIFLYSRSSNTFTRVLGPRYGLTGKWSPDGTRLLISQTSRGGGSLTASIYDTAKKEYRALDITTIPEKCAWADTRELYCAVPRTIGSESIMPDDYLRGEINPSDRIVAIDGQTGQSRDIFDEGDFDMSDLTLSKDKKYLFFIHRVDGTLWSLKLQ